MIKSVTPATPSARPAVSEYTWSQQWHTPFESLPLKLKGWVRTTTAEANRQTPAISVDTLNLEEFAYIKEPVVVDVAVEEVKPEDGTQNADLKLALSLDKKDDQISSLSGLGI